MWDLPGPGIETVSPALAGRLLTTVPPGKSAGFFLIKAISITLTHGQTEEGQIHLFTVQMVQIQLACIFKNICQVLC